jgi:radical SAM superfamily enzyme YgiQ (UPF0313 family)
MPGTFALLLVKPSHYDDDGYPSQWFRSAIPSNSLAALYGLAQGCAARRVLGDDVEIDIHAFDETNTRIRPDRLARIIEEAGAGMVMLVDVQSNQFPRALDLARPLRRRGIAVAIGGLHVSGSVAMLDGVDPDLARAETLGVSLFTGEAAGRFDEVLGDAWAGSLKPRYNYMDDLPGIEGAPIALLPRERVKRTAGAVTSFDAGRGCSYQCSFRAIIDVQGRKSRRRSAQDIELLVRANLEQRLNRFFITDDNFARNKDWESKLYLEFPRSYLRIKHGRARTEYMDLALTPVMGDETETRELFRSQAAQTYVGQEHHLDKFRRNLGSGAARAPAEHEFPLAAH